MILTTAPTNRRAWAQGRPKADALRPTAQKQSTPTRPPPPGRLQQPIQQHPPQAAAGMSTCGDKAAMKAVREGPAGCQLHAGAPLELTPDNVNCCRCHRMRRVQAHHRGILLKLAHTAPAVSRSRGCGQRRWRWARGRRARVHRQQAPRSHQAATRAGCADPQAQLPARPEAQPTAQGQLGARPQEEREDGKGSAGAQRSGRRASGAPPAHQIYCRTSTHC